MKSLLEKAGARIETAQRWVRWLRDRRNLETCISELRRESSAYRVRIDRLQADIEARDALIRDYRRERDVIPADAKTLLDEAHAVFERAMRAKSMSVADFGAWLSEYRASRFNRQHPRNDWRHSDG